MRVMAAPLRGGLLRISAERFIVNMKLVLVPLRILVGTVFAALGLFAISHLASTVATFEASSVPIAHVAAPAIAATAIVCGVMLGFGALTRPVALLLATISIGALLTAGRQGDASVLVVAPLLFIACVVFAWRSARFGSTPSRPPGVQ